MPNFRVLVRGTNFLLKRDGEAKKMGFVSTRYVSAPDVNEAELTVVDLIHRDFSDDVLNARTDPPMLNLEELEYVEALKPSTGLDFYLEN